MDNAVAIVGAYLRINGYFTVAEYPIILRDAIGRNREVTDLDILAVRFPAARTQSWRSKSTVADRASLQIPDPEMDCPSDRMDMLICEVKEGRARLNENAIRPEVLQAALSRFGCCSSNESSQTVDRLISTGKAVTAGNHTIRQLVFASDPDAGRAANYRLIGLGHVVSYMHSFIDIHWNVLHKAQFKDPVFGFMMTMAKALRSQ